MTKIFNIALKIKEVVGRVAEAKSSDPATPPKKKKLERALGLKVTKFQLPPPKRLGTVVKNILGGGPSCLPPCQIGLRKKASLTVITEQSIDKEFFNLIRCRRELLEPNFCQLP